MRSRGFTLVEMIVAIAIFMIVAVVAVGSLVRIVALNRQAQTLQASVNNIGFALDSMSREVRQGSQIGCAQSYGGGSIDPSTIQGGCTSMAFAGNQLIVFETGKTDTDVSTCNLYDAYWFKPSGSNQYLLEKAQQDYCGQSFADVAGGQGDSESAAFYSIIDSNSVHLTGYNLAIFSGAPSFLYKWVYIRLSGYAGIRAEDQNYFDVDTSISQRVND